MFAKRTLFSISVPLASIAILVLYISTGVIAQDVVNSYKIGTDYREMLVLMSAFPSVAIFAQDWTTRFWRLVALRLPIRKYALKMLLWVWITTICTALAGQWLYILFLRSRVPVLSEITYTQPWEYDFLGSILLYKHPYLYLLAQSSCASLVCGMAAILAVFITVKIPDKLVAYFAPLILYYVFSFSMEMIGIPHYLRPDYHLIGYLQGETTKDLMVMAIYVIMPIACIPMFSRLVERRCEDA